MQVECHASDASLAAWQPHALLLAAASGAVARDAVVAVGPNGPRGGSSDRCIAAAAAELACLVLDIGGPLVALGVLCSKDKLLLVLLLLSHIKSQ